MLRNVPWFLFTVPHFFPLVFIASGTCCVSEKTAAVLKAECRKMSIVEKNQENAKKVQFEGKRVNNCNLCGFENQCLTMLVLTANQGNKI